MQSPMPIHAPLRPLVLALTLIAGAVRPAAACDDERRQCWSAAILFHTASQVDVTACDAAYIDCVSRQLLRF